jgi:hypothetical protein
MVRQITESVIVKTGGVIEIRRPELREGMAVEVTIVQRVDETAPLPMSSFIGKITPSFSSAQEAVDVLRTERDAWED